MSAKLLILALICAVASAQAGIINTAYTNSADCSTMNAGTNTTTNTCVNVGDSSSAMFFDASNVYTVSWIGAGCNGTISSVLQIPTGCSTQVFGSKLTTFGSSETNPAGATFPPSGFTVSTVFVNTTVSTTSKATTCTTGNGIVSYKLASNAGCLVRASNPFLTSPSSTQGACNADGTTSGSVVFSDNTCGTVAAGTSTPVTACNVVGNNAISFSCGSAAVFPETVPVQGFVTYTNAACTLPANPITTYIGSTCFDSQTLVCGAVNGTEGYATYNSYTPASGAANGACSGADRGSQTVQAGMCVPFPAGSTTSFRKYFCASVGPGASASTASVSVVATLLAAVAAVFAVRSL